MKLLDIKKKKFSAFEFCNLGFVGLIGRLERFFRVSENN